MSLSLFIHISTHAAVSYIPFPKQPDLCKFSIFQLYSVIKPLLTSSLLSYHYTNELCHQLYPLLTFVMHCNAIIQIFGSPTD